jgi:uncharacterized protein YgiM (DUF1202 family)
MGGVSQSGSTEEDKPMKKLLSLTVAAIAAVMMTAAADAASPQPQATTGSAAVGAKTASAAMVVTHGYAHIRKDPNTKSPVLATLKKGAKVDVIEKTRDGKWAHVKSGKVDGYVALSLLKAA